MSNNSRRSNPVEMTTKMLTKKGRIKGKNKQDTAIKRGQCMHHIYNKNHKLKTRIQPGDETIYCPICRQSVHHGFPNKDKVADAVEPAIDLINLCKYLSVAGNTGRESQEYYMTLGGMMGVFEKRTNKLMKAMRRSNDIKKKKKKNRSSGSRKYGSWNIR